MSKPAKLTEEEKSALVDRLLEAGVELKGDETDAKLKKLAEKLDEGDEEEGDEDGADAEGDGKTVTVRYTNPQTGQTDRVYSLAVHGKDYKKLAAEFAEKHSGVIQK